MALTSPSIKARAIGKIPLFNSLSSDEHRRLSDVVVLKEFAKGETIISSSHQGNDIHFIADGSVDVKRASGEGKEVIISRLGAGNFIGEIALLTGLQRTADVVAVEDCIMIVLGAEAFNDLLDRSPRFARALLVDLANRVAVASCRITDLALLDVYARVYRALRSLAVERSPHVVVPERPTHRDLAAMVGTSREMVTRAISRLEEDGVIRVEGEEVIILQGIAE